MAFADSDRTFEGPANRAVLVYAFNEVGTTRRLEPAVLPKQWADTNLIATHQEHHCVGGQSNNPSQYRAGN